MPPVTGRTYDDLFPLMPWEEVMMMELKGKVAFVTGGGTDIGEACAIRLAREGARVAVMARTAEDLDETVRKIDRAGGEGLAISGDVSSASDLQDAYSQIIEQWARLDIVVANAGINGVWAPIEQLGVDEWDETLAINLRGTFMTIKFAVPLLRERGGAIVVVSSINGNRVFSSPGAVAYGCSKAGQLVITKFMAIGLGQYGIRVNCICPGRIDTDIEENTERRNPDQARPPIEFPEGDIPLTGDASGSAAQVAALAWFLASDAADHITGTEVYIDGAQSLMK